MKAISKILYGISLMAATACAENTPDLPFLSDDTPKMTVSGRELYRYAADSCQLGHNVEENEFVIISDDGADYLKAVLDKCPSGSGVTVEAVLSWIVGKEYTQNKKMTFNVEKVEGHTIWLWNGPSQTGLVLRSLE